MPKDVITTLITTIGSIITCGVFKAKKDEELKSLLERFYTSYDTLSQPNANIAEWKSKNNISTPHYKLIFKINKNKTQINAEIVKKSKFKIFRQKKDNVLYTYTIKH